jgi:hypothetical protein
LSLSRSNSAASGYFDAVQFNEEWQPIGSVMGLDGKVEPTRERLAEAAQPKPVEHRCPNCGNALLTEWARCNRCEKKPDVFALKKDERLELAVHPRDVANIDISNLDIGAKVVKSNWRPAMLLLLALGALGFGGVAYWHHNERQPRKEYTLDPSSNSASMLTITSTPSGATIRIGETEVGRTPLFIENTYIGQRVPVQLSLRGYQTWTSNFPGGVKTTVDAQLKKKASQHK